ncbi:hypothetical protein ACFMJX_28380, partial [Acinetobacter baumannii]
IALVWFEATHFERYQTYLNRDFDNINFQGYRPFHSCRLILPSVRKYQSIWEQNLAELLHNYHIQGRIKKKNNNIELLRHFVKNEMDLQELTHSHAFEIVLQS